MWIRVSRCGTSRRNSEHGSRRAGRLVTGPIVTPVHSDSRDFAREQGMAMTSQVSSRTKPAATRWYALSAEDVAGRLGVDAAGGLSAAKAAERLQQNGPNALPAEKTVPGWRRFVDQYRSYMQIILLIAAVVSFAIGQWSTGAVLVC